MRTKQFLALLLACLLLMGTACAVAPTPKAEPGTGAQEETAPENAGEVYAPHAVPHHDMDEEAAPLPADEADADGEAEPATSDEADTPFLREVFTGSFAIDENGNETVYDLFLEMATYAQYYTLAFNAKPAGGEGIALDASLRIAEAIWAVEQIAYGQLDVIDAASGALFARYTLSLGRDWNLVISDVLGNRSVETMLGEQAERAISLAFETVGLMETVDGFTPLAAKFSGLESGGTLRLSVRELLLPLVQMLYNPRLDAYVGADEREMLSALLSEMRGAFTLFTDAGVQFAYYSEGSPELSRYKAEGDVDENGLRGFIYENGNGNLRRRRPLRCGRSGRPERARGGLCGRRVYLPGRVACSFALFQRRAFLRP